MNRKDKLKAMRANHYHMDNYRIRKESLLPKINQCSSLKKENLSYSCRIFLIIPNSTKKKSPETIAVSGLFLVETGRLELSTSCV
jgi:hypothetical protein